jgi:serine protease
MRRVLVSIIAVAVMAASFASPTEAKAKRYRVNYTWQQFGPIFGWAQDRINQPFGRLDGKRPSISGSGISIYVIDTGIGEEDCNGHGSFINSLFTSNGLGIVKSANVVGVKVLNCNGSGTAQDVIAGVQWVIENADPSTSIVNMSLGGPPSSSVDAAVREMALLMPVVVAAGNDSINACNSSPARVREVITVASMNYVNMRSWFSNWGPCVDIWAPGERVDGYDKSGADQRGSGTSFSAPLVVASIAFVASRDNSTTMQAAQTVFNESSNMPIIDGRCTAGMVRCKVLFLRDEPYDWLRNDSPSWLQ